ncbi:hypothetical protein [Thalassospira marina]|uniref:Uncharacterized protein n=1 Tax=Thalassospira marina TaxID=2048283 RepID=A0A2N3KYD0_9PROT|nr:hypothetical protein [Thalassospira marina]PKR55497.1 hypothetical protein COO20_04825 [Thalassospira marina]
MRTDKMFILVGCVLFAGFWIGFAAGLDNPPAQNDIQWETLLAGAAALIGGWMAYQGALIPFKEHRKAVMIQFQYDVKEAGKDLWGVMGMANHSIDGGQGIFTSTDTDGSTIVPSEIEQLRKMVNEHLSNLPPIPREIINPVLIEIYKDFEEALFFVSINPLYDIDSALDDLLKEMERFECYIAENS